MDQEIRLMEKSDPLLSSKSSENLLVENEDLERGYEESSSRLGGQRASRKWWSALRLLGHILPWSIIALLSIDAIKARTWSSNRFQQTKRFPSQMTYSPAQSEIEYVVKTFDHNLVNSPIDFQDPETVDGAWANLYDVAGATALSREEAEKIPNVTISSASGSSEEFLVQLGVFHQIHCLDVMRHALEPFYGLKNDSFARLQANGGMRQRTQLPKRERKDGAWRQPQNDPRPWKLIGNVKHLNHCLNALRQAIMCHSDVSVLVWQWFDPSEDLPDPFGELRPYNVPYTNIPHTCRNFDKISEWARSRRPVKLPDFAAQPEDNGFHIPSWP